MSIERETMENVRKGVRNRWMAGLLALGAAVSLAACGMLQEEVGGELSAAGETAEQEAESMEEDGAESVSGEQRDASAENADDLRDTVSLDGNTVTTPISRRRFRNRGRTAFNGACTSTKAATASALKIRRQRNTTEAGISAAFRSHRRCRSTFSTSAGILSGS